MENIFTELCLAFWNLFRPAAAALAPLLTGLFLAWLLSPPVQWLTPRLGAGWSILITYAGVFLVLAAAASSFTVLILGSLPTGSPQETVSAILLYFQDASHAIAEFFAKHLPPSFSGALPKDTGLQNWLTNLFSFQSVTAALTELSKTAVSLFLGIIASVYILKDKDYFLRLWDQLLSIVLKQKIHGQFCEFLHEINQVVYAFLRGALIDSLIVALLSSAALSLLQIRFAVVIGILGGLLNIIPYFGPFISMIPAFLTAFFQFGFSRACASVILLFLVQQLDSNYIYPRIVGSSTGLHPLFVLVSVSVAGYFFGLAGMLLAVPAASVIQIIIKKWAYA